MEEAGTCRVQERNKNFYPSLDDFASHTQTRNQAGNLAAVTASHFSTSLSSGGTEDKSLFLNPFDFCKINSSKNWDKKFNPSNSHQSLLNELPLTSSSNINNSNIYKIISQTNIQKTISEIAVSQKGLLPVSTVSQSAIAESTMSNIPPTTVGSGNGYIAIQHDLLSVSHSNVFQNQAWSTESFDDVNSGQSSDYSIQSCLAANVTPQSMPLPAYSCSSINSEYVPAPNNPSKDYHPHQQDFLDQIGCTGQMNSLLQNPQLSLEDFRLPLQHEKFTEASAPNFTGIASEYHKMDNYTEEALFANDNNVNMLHAFSNSSNPNVPTNVSYNDQCKIPASSLVTEPLPQSNNVSNMLQAGENKEKSLTVTPTPSDTEKISGIGSSSSSSSSSSSVSESGNEQSPRSRFIDSDTCVSMENNHAVMKESLVLPGNKSYLEFSGANQSHVIHHQDDLSQTNGSLNNSGLNSLETLTNKNLQAQVPEPDKIVEVDETLLNIGSVEHAREKIPVSPINCTPRSSDHVNTQISTQSRFIDKTESQKKTSINAERSSVSWSIVKEERRKRKLEKKIEMATTSSSSIDNQLIKKPQSKNKQQNRSKHNKSNSSKYHQLPINVLSIPQISGNSYSGLIPKATADPTNNTRSKSTGPPRSITEKVVKERMKAVNASSKCNSKPDSNDIASTGTALGNTTTSSVQNKGGTVHDVGNSVNHIVPAKLSALDKEVKGKISGTCRWQTVTAVQAPKMPPMLSESDRIPKRGRPSKKMSEMNLKLKVDKKETNSAVEAAKVAGDPSNVVSMYKINESGCYESLDNKSKLSQRSKERAEAFRNELLEISKKTAIQKKTAGAKDAVGAFKANGVRTRKQVSDHVIADQDNSKKKLKMKNKVFGGTTSSASTSKTSDKMKVMDENTVYTFSELAKQFKISNSILFRAMEQSQRSGGSKKNIKSGHRQKEKIIKPKSNVSTEAPACKTAEIICQQHPLVQSQVLPKENAETKQEEITSASRLETVSPIKPTSLSSEKSTDLTGDEIKRKKRKKKHKKEKKEVGAKKKKNKIKKKKSKRKEGKLFSDSTFNFDSNNEVFSEVPAKDLVLEIPGPLEVTSKGDSKNNRSQLKSKTASLPESTSVASDLPVHVDNLNVQIGSESSFSAEEEAYDACDSSSDAEVAANIKSSREESGSANVHVFSDSVTGSTSAPTTNVFGSGISSIMPSFHGIKEHGGLQNFSEHTNNLNDESNLFRGKRHKHKKKKQINRAKNITDPEFLSKISAIINNLSNLKLGPSVSLSSRRSPLNVFAKIHTNFMVSSASKESSGSLPSKQKVSATNISSLPSSFNSNMSVYCQSSFFTNHGFIKRYSHLSDGELLKQKPVSSVSQISFDYCSSDAQPVFAQNSCATNQECKSSAVTPSETTMESGGSSSQLPFVSGQSKPPSRRPGRPRGTGKKQQRMRSKSEMNCVRNKTSFLKESVNVQVEEDILSQPPSSDELQGFSSKTVQDIGSARSETTTIPNPANNAETNSSSSNRINTSSKTDANPVMSPINQQLVDHIKATLSSSSAVASESVAKIVDSAVASYLQNFEIGNSAATSSKEIVKAPRRRGRPPKYPKLMQQLNQAAADTAPEKHPKKLWASKHQVSNEKLRIKLKSPSSAKSRKHPAVTSDAPPSKIAKKSTNSSSNLKISAINHFETKTHRKSAHGSKSSFSHQTRSKLGRQKPSSNYEGKLETHKQKSSKIVEHNKISKSKVVVTSLLLKKNNSSVRLRKESSENIKNSVKDKMSGLKAGHKMTIESVVAKLKNWKDSTTVKTGCSSNEKSTHLKATAKSRIRMEKDFSDQTTSAPSDELLSTKAPYKSSYSEQKFERFMEKTRTSQNLIFPSKMKKNKKVDKKWIQAGLFSSTFKLESAQCIVHNEDTHPLLPPPEHAGLFLREKYKAFQLPHNLWSLYQKNEHSTEHSVRDNYISIDRNISLESPITIIERIEPACDCSSGNCGQDCKNRSHRIECHDKICEIGERCMNNTIKKRKIWNYLEKFNTIDKGWGVRTTEDIPKGTFLVEYVGEVISDVEFRRRVFETYSLLTHRYYLLYETNKVIDSSRLGNISRYVNHSCQPNCEIQTWHSEGEVRCCLFSNQPISAGDELTFDYAAYVGDMFKEKQQCKCGSPRCRGTLEGVMNNQEASEQKTIKQIKKKKSKDEADESGGLMYTTVYEDRIQPTSHEEAQFIKRYRPFLMRNLVKLKLIHERAGIQDNAKAASSDCTQASKDERRQLLYDAIKEIFDQIMTCKDENDVSVAIPFINLPSKNNGRDSNPFDLGFVEDKIVTEQYEKLEEFSTDLLRAFRNAEKQFGRKSSLGRNVARLRRVYALSRNKALALLGENRDKVKSKVCRKNEAELEERRRNGDYIRCICGIYKDEGVMIQCEKCFVWQHCDCMRVDVNDYKDGIEYLCEECDGREVQREVEVVPQPPSAPPGHTYYLTLLKDDHLIKQGDCVRLIHDHCLRQRHASNPPLRSSYRLQSHSAPESMDFFRIKKLWTDDNGDKFAYGSYFVRPHDTKHPESRLFFTNELLNTPFHEIVPLDAVVSHCCVMDLETFRRGKPKGFANSDIFICQHGTDLSLRISNKVIKNRFPICTKSHVFDFYPVELVTVRDYQVSEQYRKSQPRRTQWLKSAEHVESDQDNSSDEDGEIINGESLVTSDVLDAVNEETDTSGGERNSKEERLNGILSKLIRSATVNKHSNAAKFK